MKHVNDWLNHHGSSLGKLCDEMGLPGRSRRNIVGRTPTEVRSEVQAFFDAHGRRPKNRDLISCVQWLMRRQTTLTKLCNEMGIPGAPGVPRTFVSCRKNVESFVAEHNRRPTVEDMKAVDSWLFLRGSSLRKLCSEMGWPFPKWNQVNTRKTVQGFFDAHGRRPRHIEMRGLALYLHRSGSSLVSLCDEMGLPPHARGKR